MSSKVLYDPIAAPDPRAKPRQRVLLSGKMVQDNGLSPDCTIRNLTDGGAQIRVAEGQAVPDQFYLIEIRSGTAFRADVAWRKPAEAGLKFSERLDLSLPDAPIHLRKLWLGCAQRGVSGSEG